MGEHNTNSDSAPVYQSAYDKHRSKNKRYVEDVCEWKLHDFDGRKMYNSPENCGYHATHPEFTYCPSCGKPIKYAEEE